MSTTNSNTSLLSPGEWRTNSSNAGRKDEPQRPSFSSSITSDRLRESERMPPSPVISKAKTCGPCSSSEVRKSAFKEVGLEEYQIANSTGLSSLRSASNSPSNLTRNEMKNNGKESDQRPWFWRLSKPSRPAIRTSASTPPATFSSLPRVAILAFLIAIVIPGIRNRGWDGDLPAGGVGAGLIGTADIKVDLERRDNSPTDVCTRWSQQSQLSKSRKKGKWLTENIGAIVNGTVYVYGGQAKTSASQSSNTWSKFVLCRKANSTESNLWL
jgi:hypothetical protein